MSRCDHCQYIGSWDCEDSRVPDNKLCENFVLRFETLTDKTAERNSETINVKQ